MKEPESMNDLMFFTNRNMGASTIKAWVYRPLCAKCKKGRVGKPINPKSKAINKKAEYYECNHCKAQTPVEDIDKDLKVEVKYKCPGCGNEGFATTEYKRKTWQGVPAFVFECSKCKEKIGITKKMKKPK